MKFMNCEANEKNTMKKTIIKITLITALFGIIFTLSSCTTTPPDNPKNVCSIFQQYPKWYWAAQDIQKKWGLPEYVLMAIIYQESRFQQSVKPAREYILWVIPWFRPTSAYGYAQAIDNTWKLYQKDTGNTGATRDNFADAVDFIGWYAERIHQKTGLSKWNAYGMYLAYHEGIGNYKRGTYKRKQWLINVAKGVQARAYEYRRQLNACRNDLPEKPWWHVW